MWLQLWVIYHRDVIELSRLLHATGFYWTRELHQMRCLHGSMSFPCQLNHIVILFEGNNWYHAWQIHCVFSANSLMAMFDIDCDYNIFWISTRYTNIILVHFKKWTTKIMYNHQTGFMFNFVECIYRECSNWCKLYYPIPCRYHIFLFRGLRRRLSWNFIDVNVWICNYIYFSYGSKCLSMPSIQF